MAYTETKVIQVKNDPELINRINDANAKFLWSVLSTQITNSQNTKISQDWKQYGTDEYTVTETTIDYATITYQRDKDDPRYDEISRLEEAYHSTINEYESNLKRKAPWFKEALICGVAAFILQLVAEIKDVGFWTVVAILLCALGVFAIVFGIKKNSSAEKHNESMKAKYGRKLDEINAAAERVRRTRV